MCCGFLCWVCKVLHTSVLIFAPNIIKFLMTHKYFANLTLGITYLTQEEYNSVKAILFDSLNALALVKIPNQWLFLIQASSRQEAKSKITKTLAYIMATLNIPELMFSLSVSAENITYRTMRNKRIFSLEKAMQSTNLGENKC